MISRVSRNISEIRFANTENFTIKEIADSAISFIVLSRVLLSFSKPKDFKVSSDSGNNMWSGSWAILPSSYKAISAFIPFFAKLEY